MCPFGLFEPFANVFSRSTTTELQIERDRLMKSRPIELYNTKIKKLNILFKWEIFGPSKFH